MFSNQKSPRSSRVKGLAFVSIALALLMSVTAFGAGGSHFAFIDSVTEFFGLQSTIAPALSDTQTLRSNESQPTIRIESPAIMGGMTVSLPAVNSTPGNIVVPVTVSDTTGEGIFGYDIQVSFDDTVVQPDGTGVDAAATLSSAMTVTSGTSFAGHLIVSAFDINPLSGAGTLINLKFTVQNNPGTSTNLTFADYTDPGSVFHYGMRFNEGSPTASTTNGSVTIPAATATNTATDTATATNTSTATATSTATFTPTPVAPCGSGARRGSRHGTWHNAYGLCDFGAAFEPSMLERTQA